VCRTHVCASSYLLTHVAHSAPKAFPATQIAGILRDSLYNTHNKQISRFIYSLALLKCSSCLLQGLIIGIVRAHFQTSRPHTHTHNTRHVRMCVCHFSFLSLPTSQSTGNFHSKNTVACSACLAIILYGSICCGLCRTTPLKKNTMHFLGLLVVMVTIVHQWKSCTLSPVGLSLSL
jgi:hypothetical protein